METRQALAMLTEAAMAGAGPVHRAVYMEASTALRPAVHFWERLEAANEPAEVGETNDESQGCADVSGTGT